MGSKVVIDLGSRSISRASPASMSAIIMMGLPAETRLGRINENVRAATRRGRRDLENVLLQNE